jgi:Uma2 family endonuclease
MVGFSGRRRGPDIIARIAADRIAPERATMRNETPLLAIEVISESQTRAELAPKAQAYRQAGIDEVWRVDHKARSVEIWNAVGTTTLLDTQTLTSPLLPSFGVPVRFLFDG